MTDQLRLRDDLHWRPVADEVIGLDLSGGRYLSVNRSGALLWPLLQAGTSADVLVDELATAFDLTPEQARADVEAWLAVLDAEGLLVREQA